MTQPHEYPTLLKSISKGEGNENVSDQQAWQDGCHCREKKAETDQTAFATLQCGEPISSPKMIT